MHQWSTRKISNFFTVPAKTYSQKQRFNWKYLCQIDKGSFHSLSHYFLAIYSLLNFKFKLLNDVIATLLFFISDCSDCLKLICHKTADLNALWHNQPSRIFVLLLPNGVLVHHFDNAVKVIKHVNILNSMCKGCWKVSKWRVNILFSWKMLLWRLCPSCASLFD